VGLQEKEKGKSPILGDHTGTLQKKSLRQELCSLSSKQTPEEGIPMHLHSLTSTMEGSLLRRGLENKSHRWE
jgi:hypothetical protein